MLCADWLRPGFLNQLLAKQVQDYHDMYIDQWFANLSMHQNYLEDLLNQSSLCLSTRVSDSVSPEKSLRTCLPDKFWGGPDAVAPHFGNY